MCTIYLNKNFDPNDVQLKCIIHLQHESILKRAHKYVLRWSNY